MVDVGEASGQLSRQQAKETPSPSSGEEASGRKIYRPRHPADGLGRLPPHDHPPESGAGVGRSRTPSPCIAGSGPNAAAASASCGKARLHEAKGRSGRSQIQVPGMNRDVEGRDTASGGGSASQSLRRQTAGPADGTHGSGARSAHLCRRDRLIDLRRAPRRMV